MSASKFLNGVDAQGNRIIGVADPTANTDAANKQYVDNRANGLSFKLPVRAASTANMNVASAVINGASMDGVSLVTGDRVLLKDQTAPAENGIYIVAASGAASRAPDADTAAELRAATVVVEQGTANADKQYTQTADNITLGTTALVWATSGSSVYSEGNGIDITGNVVSAQAGDTTITVDSAGIKVNLVTLRSALKYSANIGALTANTPLNIVHNLNTTDVHVTTRIASTGEIVDMNPVIVDANTVSVVSVAAAGSGVYRITVVG